MEAGIASAAAVPQPLAPAREGRRHYLVGVLALAALYYGAAHLGYALEFSGAVGAIVWLPVGVGAAFLYLGGLRYWPGVLIGDLLVNDYTVLPVGSALGQTVGNVLEVVTVAYLMQRLTDAPLSSVRGVGRMFVAIVAGCVVSATIGTLSSLLGDVIDLGDVPKVWRTWWLGDACGALVVVPLVLAWWRRGHEFLRGRRLEFTLMLAAVTVLSALVLSEDRPLTYLVYPALIWAATRFGKRGATIAIAITVAFALWNTTRLLGPFASNSTTHTVLTTQLYIAVTALTTLCLAAMASERAQLAVRLRASRIRLVTAADTERRRIEHNLHDGAQQRLTALIVRLGLASDRARENPAEAPELFAQAEAELSRALDELRELAHGIHPKMLTDLGLARAVESLAERASVRVELLELPTRRLDETAEATAYYVVSEAVTNAQKHGAAQSIRIRAAESFGVLRVVVADDGVGGARERPGSGLEGLRDRVEAVGGMLWIQSQPGRGTRVSATIPVAKSPT